MTAATATQYMWTNMHCTCLERVDPRVPLAALSNRAALFLERATNDTEEVFEVIVLREEHRFLMMLELMSTTTIAECVELLFRRTDILTRAAWTPFLRCTADLAGAGECGQTLLLQVQISQRYVLPGLWLGLPGCAC